MAKTQSKAAGPNFGDLGWYSGGKQLPEGNYAVEFELVMHAGTKADGSPSGPERLGTMLHAHPITDEGEAIEGADVIDHFISMGTKAHESWAPDPETGKSLVPVPGGPSMPANNKTNWVAFLKSLYDCGMPQGTLENDFTVIDGVWVHTTNVPEPEERKGFKSNTGENQTEERRSGMMVVVSEILDGGKPWEGGGGIPEATPKKKGPQGVVKGKVAPKKVKEEEPEEEEEAGDEDTRDNLTSVLTDILAENEKGLPKVKLRIEVFKASKKKFGDEGAQAVAKLFDDADALSNLLEEAGFKLKGSTIVPA